MCRVTRRNHYNMMMFWRAADSGQCGVFFEDADFNGRDVKKVFAENKEECLQRCRQERCNALTFSPRGNARCILKVIPESRSLGSFQRAISSPGAFAYRECPLGNTNTPSAVLPAKNPSDAAIVHHLRLLTHGCCALLLCI